VLDQKLELEAGRCHGSGDLGIAHEPLPEVADLSLERPYRPVWHGFNPHPRAATIGAGRQRVLKHPHLSSWSATAASKRWTAAVRMNSDFEDLLKAFNDSGVRYGEFAVTRPTGFDEAVLGIPAVREGERIAVEHPLEIHAFVYFSGEFLNLGDKILGRYGFADAFHPGNGWVAEDVIALDVGIRPAARVALARPGRRNPAA
jgi:hypothetical protein